MKKINYDQVMLFAFSLAISIIWQFNYSTWFTSDSLDYYEWAKGIAGAGSAYPVHRSPGYPIILFLSGVFSLKTFLILRFYQCLMSAFIPVLVYNTIRIWSKIGARFAGWATIASTVPYTYTTCIMTEQASMFLFYLFLLLAAKFFADDRKIQKILVFEIAAIGWFLILIRPANGLLIYLFILCSLIFKRRKWQSIVSIFILVVLLNGLWFLCDARLFTLGGNMSHFINKSDKTSRKFGEIYYGKLIKKFCQEKFSEPLFSPNMGPASAKLFEILKKFLLSKKENWENLTPQNLIGLYKGRPEVLIERIQADPSFTYCAFISSALRVEIGEYNTKKLCKELAREYSLFSFKDLIKSLLFGVSSHMDGKMLFWQVYNGARFYGVGDPYSRTSLIKPENGPATRFFLSQILKYLKDYPDHWNPLGPQAWFGDFKEKPDMLLQRMFDHPDLIYHWFLWTIMDNQFGPKASNVLFAKVAHEAISHPFRGPLIFWDNFINAAIGPGEVNFNGGIRTVAVSQMNILDMRKMYYSQNMKPYPSLPDSLNKEITSYSPNVDLNTYAYWIIYSVRPFILIGILCFSMFALMSTSKTWFIFACMVLIVQLLIPSVYASPHVRYLDYLIPLQIMMATVGYNNYQRFKYKPFKKALE